VDSDNLLGGCSARVAEPLLRNIAPVFKLEISPGLVQWHEHHHRRSVINAIDAVGRACAMRPASVPVHIGKTAGIPVSFYLWNGKELA
jgi:hypothetical protein